jgi:phosphoglucosamine mutase
MAECVALTRELALLTSELGDAGRVMVRFSGTEAKLRLLAEAGTQATVDGALERLTAAACIDLKLL